MTHDEVEPFRIREGDHPTPAYAIAMALLDAFIDVDPDDTWPGAKCDEFIEVALANIEATLNKAGYRIERHGTAGKGVSV